MRLQKNMSPMADREESEKRYIQKRKLKADASGILYYLFRIFPIKKNKITFSAFEGAGYCCNPKYIAEELIARQQKGIQEYEMIWLTNDINKEFPPEIKQVRNNLWNRAYHLTTSKLWIDNARKNWGTKKRKGQFYLQTWHGPVGFKPVGRLRGEQFSKIGTLVSEADAKNIDVLLSNSDWCTDKWEKSFWGERVEKTGSPRCDILINKRDEQYKKIRKEFGLGLESKIVLYAPTFRGGSQNKKREVYAEEFTIDFEMVQKNLKQRFGGDWYIFVRLHPQLALRMQKIHMTDSSHIIDISDKDDLYKYLAAVDVVITDYSSVAFDAAYMKLPVFLYVDDYEEYVGDRGALLWRMDEIPFPTAENNNRLSHMIVEFNQEDYIPKLEKVFTSMGLLEDGKATQRVVDMIEDVI